MGSAVVEELLGELVSLAVVIPTRSRPTQLAECLAALAAARRRVPFPAYVCDSSPTAEDRRAVQEICSRYDWVRLRHHDGRNVTAARNFCAAVAEEELLVNVDDDLVPEPEAIERLLAVYRQGSGRRVVGGYVSWGGGWIGPMKMRAIGYARPPVDGERPDFAPSALFLYPRTLARALPWNERLDQSTDIFMGALWRRHGVRILCAPDARALHPDPPQGFDPDDVGSTADHQWRRIYVLLWDALIANPSAKRAISYEVLGFFAGIRLYYRHPRWLARYLGGWVKGHRRLLADWRYLRALARSKVSTYG